MSLLNLKLSPFILNLLLLLNGFHISEKLLHTQIILSFLFHPEFLLICCSLLNHLCKVTIVVTSLGFRNRLDKSTGVPNLVIWATTHHDGRACTSQWHRGDHARSDRLSLSARQIWGHANFSNRWWCGNDEEWRLCRINNWKASTTRIHIKEDKL